MSAKILTALLGVLVLGTAGNASAADMPTIRYAQGQFAGGMSKLAYTIADRKGFFTREGVRVELVKVTGLNAPAFEKGYIPAIERGGPADICSIPDGQFVQVVLNGSDGVAIAAQHANPIESIIVRPEIKSFADLKGKKITLTAPWDAITLTAQKLLKIHGLKPSDYSFESIPGTEARMACLKAGKCSAATVGQPDDIDAVKMGFRRLGTSVEAGRVVFNVEAVTREWARKNKETLVRYLRADADAMRFIHDPKNRGEVTETLASLMKESPDVVNEMMDNIENPKLQPLTAEAEINLADFKHTLDLIKEFGLTTKPLPPLERLVDQSYAKAAGIQ